MNKINILSVMTCAVIAFGAASVSSVSVAEDKMMVKEGAMMMEKKAMSHEMPFTSEAFSDAQASGKPFLVAFHKKGCPMCASQKEALKEVYADPKYKDLKVLVVNYDNDTASLKKFNIGMQGALILYKGKAEVSRSEALVKATDIEKQLQG
jgi:thiol-disulfide isomerase/thioredoxin